ncbi:hypothetical protein MHAS44199_06480 [Mycolicibacterium hassiacum DSM 44199]|nr:hypothetical protein [Mycolicibacterium hassiacum DSM 44199]
MDNRRAAERAGKRSGIRLVTRRDRIEQRTAEPSRR